MATQPDAPDAPSNLRTFEPDAADAADAADARVEWSLVSQTHRVASLLKGLSFCNCKQARRSKRKLHTAKTHTHCTRPGGQATHRKQRCSSSSSCSRQSLSWKSPTQPAPSIVPQRSCCYAAHAASDTSIAADAALDSRSAVNDRGFPLRLFDHLASSPHISNICRHRHTDALRPI